MQILRNSGIFSWVNNWPPWWSCSPRLQCQKEPSFFLQIWLRWTCSPIKSYKHMIDSSWIGISPSNICGSSKCAVGQELEFKVPFQKICKVVLHHQNSSFLWFQVWSCVDSSLCSCTSWLTQILRPLRCDLFMTGEIRSVKKQLLAGTLSWQQLNSMKAKAIGESEPHILQFGGLNSSNPDARWWLQMLHILLFGMILEFLSFALLEFWPSRLTSSSTCSLGFSLVFLITP